MLAYRAQNRYQRFLASVHQKADYTGRYKNEQTGYGIPHSMEKNRLPPNRYRSSALMSCWLYYIPPVAVLSSTLLKLIAVRCNPPMASSGIEPFRQKRMHVSAYRALSIQRQIRSASHDIPFAFIQEFDLPILFQVHPVGMCNGDLRKGDIVECAQEAPTSFRADREFRTCCLFTGNSA